MEQQKIKSQFMLAIFQSNKKKKDIAAKMEISCGYLNNMLTGDNKLTDKRRAELNKILKTKI